MRVLRKRRCGACLATSNGLVRDDLDGTSGGRHLVRAEGPEVALEVERRVHPRTEGDASVGSRTISAPWERARAVSVRVLDRNVELLGAAPERVGRPFARALRWSRQHRAARPACSSANIGAPPGSCTTRPDASPLAAPETAHLRARRE